MLSKNIRQFGTVAQQAGAGSVKAAVSALKNGTKVATETREGSNVSSVVAWVNAGSRHDAAHGSARLLQRLATRGTKKRNPDQLRADLQSIGGSLNTELYRENAVYQLNVLNKDLPKAVELLGDIVTNPNIADDKTVNEEKTAHSQEIRKCIYNEMFEHLHECAFHDTPLGRTVTGAENAANLSKGDVANYFAANYTGDRVAVAAVGGGVEHGQFKDLVEKSFGGLAAGSGAGAKVAPAIYAGSDKRIRYDSMDKAHVFLGFEAANRSSSHVYTQLLVQQLVGSWDRLSVIHDNSASRLARELAEEKAVHSFGTFNRFYSDTGLFGVHFVAGDNTLEQAVWLILQNLVRLCHNLTEEEVSRAKAQLLTTMLSKQDCVHSTAHTVARQTAHFGRRVSREETIARIQALTVKDVADWANLVINDEDHVLAAKGPLHELPDYNFIRRRTYWQRY